MNETVCALSLEFSELIQCVQSRYDGHVCSALYEISCPFQLSTVPCCTCAGHYRLGCGCGCSHPDGRVVDSPSCIQRGKSAFPSTATVDLEKSFLSAKSMVGFNFQVKYLIGNQQHKRCLQFLFAPAFPGSCSCWAFPSSWSGCWRCHTWASSIMWKERIPSGMPRGCSRRSPTNCQAWARSKLGHRYYVLLSDFGGCWAAQAWRLRTAFPAQDKAVGQPIDGKCVFLRVG